MANGPVWRKHDVLSKVVAILSSQRTGEIRKVYLATLS